MVVVGIGNAVFNSVAHVGGLCSCCLLRQERDILVSLCLVFHNPSVLFLLHIGIDFSHYLPVFDKLRKTLVVGFGLVRVLGEQDCVLRKVVYLDDFFAGRVASCCSCGGKEAEFVVGDNLLVPLGYIATLVLAKELVIAAGCSNKSSQRPDNDIGWNSQFHRSWFLVLLNKVLLYSLCAFVQCKSICFLFFCVAQSAI